MFNLSLDWTPHPVLALMLTIGLVSALLSLIELLLDCYVTPHRKEMARLMLVIIGCDVVMVAGIFIIPSVMIYVGIVGFGLCFIAFAGRVVCVALGKPELWSIERLKNLARRKS